MSGRQPVWLQENPWPHQILVLAVGLLLVGYGGSELTSAPEPGLFYGVTLWAAVVAGVLFLLSIPFGVRRILKEDRTSKTTAR